MATYKKIGYFYIGLFTLAGLLLLVIALVVFGSKGVYKDSVYVETYFNESVQGLTVGSPVKYRGMEIGKIIDIATANSIYTVKYEKITDVEPLQTMKYIYVRIIIDLGRFQGITYGDLEQNLATEIANGLRVKISAQGLTGNAHLELDYVKSGTSILSIWWQPKDYYIPSTPSALTFFGDNMQRIMENLGKIDLRKTFNSINELTISTKQTVNDVDKLITTYKHQTVEILTNLQTITENLKTVSERAKAYPSSILFGDLPPHIDPTTL